MRLLLQQSRNSKCFLREAKEKFMTERDSVAASVTLDEALALTRLPEEELLRRADAVREAAFGRRISLCAIINARSGNCGMDCAFCSQSRRSTTAIPVFPMLDAESLRERILRLAELPVCHIGIVTSGGALQDEELAVVGQVLQSLPEPVRARVCGSLGRLPQASLERLSGWGLRRFHHNLETASTRYAAICTTQTWDQRRATILRARSAGLSTCTGGIFGLGESWEDRCRFALELAALHADNVPVNFLYPHPGTPLADQPPLEAGEALRIIAVLRCLLPQATLRICGGRPTTLGARQTEIFRVGANALMTGDYLTTCGNGAVQDLRMIADAGFEVVQP